MQAFFWQKNVKQILSAGAPSPMRDAAGREVHKRPMSEAVDLTRSARRRSNGRYLRTADGRSRRQATVPADYDFV
jgi:hypothetical protein